jgi:hypothetical protein
MGKFSEVIFFWGLFFDVKETEDYVFEKDIDVSAINSWFHAEAHNEIF